MLRETTSRGLCDLVCMMCVFITAVPIKSCSCVFVLQYQFAWVRATGNVTVEDIVTILMQCPEVGCSVQSAARSSRPAPTSAAAAAREWAFRRRPRSSLAVYQTKPAAVGPAPPISAAALVALHVMK